MGYSIDALIGHKPINEIKAKELGLALIYESEFVIIPLIDENIYHYEIENKFISEDYGDNISFDSKTTLQFAKLLGLKKYVIMTLSDPDFLGSYYEGSKKISHETGINKALNLLGVPNSMGSEFDYLNLNNYRNSEFYYMDEICGHKDISNIIKGNILYPDWNKS